ncbi:MAG: hypothetical protein CUN55_03205 [Phototrophicales bacterium]|nr:MAG: hypothetical protein CUN55_03205 [Phototrophicales bacterium]
MRRSVVVSFFLMLCGGILVACGTTADALRPTFEPTPTFNFGTRVALEQTRTARQSSESSVEVAQADDNETIEPTLVPTATPLPPTTTPVPPTPTSEPTEVVEEATDENTQADDIYTLFPDLPRSADPTVGDLLFHNIVAPDTGQNCTTCHNVEEPIPGTGPYLYGIANHAAEHAEGLTAVEYLFTSIKYPNEHIAPPQGDKVWSAGVMPQTWSQVLSDEDIYHIVAYLLTLNQSGHSH